MPRHDFDVYRAVAKTHFQLLSLLMEIMSPLNKHEHAWMAPLYRLITYSISHLLVIIIYFHFIDTWWLRTWKDRLMALGVFPNTYTPEYFRHQNITYVFISTHGPHT